ncbi:hypothetical protein ACFLUL_00870 [Chloroflexota bacterium]
MPTNSMANMTGWPVRWTMLPEMNDKNANIQRVAEEALKDAKLLSELLDGLKSKKETFRYNCFKVLDLISEEHGDMLYPEWDTFVEQLNSDNTYWKLSGLQLIANLTKVDTENKFEEIFDRYYHLLDDRSMITAVYIARNSGKIVRTKPELESSITDKLLNIDETHHDPERRDLIKSGVIEAFGEYYELASDKGRIVEFVRHQLDSKSPKTKKLARAFLTRFGAR